MLYRRTRGRAAQHNFRRSPLTPSMDTWTGVGILVIMWGSRPEMVTVTPGGDCAGRVECPLILSLPPVLTVLEGNPCINVCCNARLIVSHSSKPRTYCYLRCIVEEVPRRKGVLLGRLNTDLVAQCLPSAYLVALLSFIQ